jgi:hypothetical protein
MDNFEKMLADVRSSFRLLYYFNSRILSLMTYIGRKFDIPYIGGWPRYTLPSPRYGKGGLDWLAWDWLNFYFYEFHFAKGEIKLSVFLVSDTGMWDTDAKPWEVEKFEKADKARTKLIFVFSRHDWVMVELSHKVSEKIKTCGETFKILDAENRIKYCMIFNLNEFKDNEATNSSLNRFNEYLKSNEITDLIIGEVNIS